ncbi:MAG TPA: 2-hydroxyacid dehydrogenase [Candidatus Paceibacterota bacterium]|nr:2-hydroxyacid dehydrogenase [Candidatus Paceibacterota bacterium]
MKHAVWTQWEDIAVPDGIERLTPTSTPLDISDLSKITFYVPSYMEGRRALEYVKSMPNLKVLQMPNAGYEDALEYLRPGLTLCNGRGIHNDSTAELAVGMAIASLRGFPRFVLSQSQGKWDPAQFRSINDRKIGIVGFGAIGQTIARNLSGFDVEVIGFSRSGRDGAVKIKNFDDYLPSLDVVILIMPLNDESHRFFDARRFALLKTGALLINVARGAIIDTDALLAELRTGRITVALDVTDPEPLPPDHPLWKEAGVFITPHVGGNSSAFEPRARRLIESQLIRLAASQPLENVVAQGRDQ